MEQQTCTRCGHPLVAMCPNCAAPHSASNRRISLWPRNLQNWIDPLGATIGSMRDRIEIKLQRDTASRFAASPIPYDVGFRPTNKMSRMALSLTRTPPAPASSGNPDLGFDTKQIHGWRRPRRNPGSPPCRICRNGSPFLSHPYESHGHGPGRGRLRRL